MYGLTAVRETNKVAEACGGVEETLRHVPTIAETRMVYRVDHYRGRRQPRADDPLNTLW